MATGETREQLIARLRTPIVQADGGWADTHGRYGGKVEKGMRADGKGKRFGYEEMKTLDAAGNKVGDADGPTLPADKQAQIVLPAESFKIEKMEMSQTDEDLVLECQAGMEAEAFIDIEPMFLTKEEYFYGFTADSDAKISIDHGMSSAIEGEMNAKEHGAKSMTSSTATDGSLKKGTSSRRIMIKLKFKPGFDVGEFDAYLGFMFPNEKAFSKFYKITGKST